MKTKAKQKKMNILLLCFYEHPNSMEIISLKDCNIARVKLILELMSGSCSHSLSIYYTDGIWTMNENSNFMHDMNSEAK